VKQAFYTAQTPFLSPNQTYQSSEGLHGSQEYLLHFQSCFYENTDRRQQAQRMMTMTIKTI